ncbi:MAG: hypothetical protein JSS02_11365 [Planctomycetes bacterium]|nr:hypothetical protein [Planctomycetota bacterium]
MTICDCGSGAGEIWDIAPGAWRLNLEAYAATALRFTTDGHTLISADPGGTVKLWHSLKGDSHDSALWSSTG